MKFQLVKVVFEHVLIKKPGTMTEKRHHTWQVIFIKKLLLLKLSGCFFDYFPCQLYMFLFGISLSDTHS